MPYPAHPVLPLTKCTLFALSLVMATATCRISGLAQRSSGALYPFCSGASARSVGCMSEKANLPTACDLYRRMPVRVSVHGQLAFRQGWHVFPHGTAASYHGTRLAFCCPTLLFPPSSGEHSKAAMLCASNCSGVVGFAHSPQVKKGDATFSISQYMVRPCRQFIPPTKSLDRAGRDRTAPDLAKR